MKRFFLWVLILMLCAGALADTGIDWSVYSTDAINTTIAELTEMLNEARAELSRRSSGKTYTIDGIDFTVDFYRDDLIQKYKRLLVKVNWTNNTSSATSFLWSLAVRGYQDGKELDSSYRESYGGDGQMDNILPGYSATAYILLSLRSDGDVKIIITDLFYAGNAEKGVVFDLNPDSLPLYEK